MKRTQLCHSLRYVIELTLDLIGVDEFWNFQYTGWPQWNDMDCHLAPLVSSARSSTECTPLRPNDPELSWPDTHAQQYEFYGGQELPQSPSNSYNEHVSLSSFQPHMPNCIRPTPTAPVSSPAFNFPSSAATPSTLYQNSLPHISTVSPYASSDSSSSSPSPLSTPEITIRTPISVHQPRPSRRIPIFSLSELASACDDFSMSPTNSFHQKPSRELLSPLTTNISANYISPYSPMHLSFSDEMGSEGAVPFTVEEKNAYTAPTRLFNDSEEVVICSCGCMASYTIPQSL